MTKSIRANNSDRTNKPDTTEKRERGSNGTTYLSDFIYGAIDGTVTTFAVVSGVAGAGLSSNIVIILGLANLVGDGFSMAASNFLGTRANEQLREKARAEQSARIEQTPEDERQEVRKIYASKGFANADLDRIVDVTCEDKTRWLDTILDAKLDLNNSHRSPTWAATATFIAFLLVGSIPLIPFAAPLLTSSSTNQPDAPFLLSCLFTAFAFFGVGAIKSRFVQQHWLLAGCETLLLGGSAAALAFLVGRMLRGFA